MSAGDLQDVLYRLETYGKPRLSRMEGGWSVTVDMNTEPKGASFTVRSEFDHATPMEAATECLARIRSMLDGLSAIKRIEA